MRGLLIAGCLLLCVGMARAQESPGSLRLVPGGFAPAAANFRVTFVFSDMRMDRGGDQAPRSQLSAPGVAGATEHWSSAEGAAADLDVCCLTLPLGLSDIVLAVARVRLSNPTSHACQTSLAVTITPEGELRALAFEQESFFSEGHPILIADTPSRGCTLADSPFATRPLSPQDHGHVESPKGECRGEMIFDLVLQPGQSQTLNFSCPLKVPAGNPLDLKFYRSLSLDELFQKAEKESSAK